MADSNSGISRRKMLRVGLGAAAVSPALWCDLPEIPKVKPAVAPAKRAAVTGAATPASSLRVRPNILDLTADEKKAMVRAFKQMKKMQSPWSDKFSYYDQFVYWHKRTLAWENGMAHMGPAIWPWHRQLLLLFEGGMQEAMGNPDFNLPYWDWTQSEAVDVVFAEDFMGGDGEATANFKVKTGPFAGNKRWRLNVIPQPEVDPHQLRSLHRRFGMPGDIVLPGGQYLHNPGGLLPTQASVDEALAVTAYDVPFYDTASPVDQSFRNALEGFKNYGHMYCGSDGQMTGQSMAGSRVILHSQVHVWVGGVWNVVGEGTPYQGSMVPNTSPNDPVFFIHHCNGDRLWWQWQQIHGVGPENYQPEMGAHTGHNLHDEMWPYCATNVAIHTTPEDMLDTTAFGDQAYTYPAIV